MAAALLLVTSAVAAGLPPAAVATGGTGGDAAVEGGDAPARAVDGTRLTSGTTPGPADVRPAANTTDLRSIEIGRAAAGEVGADDPIANDTDAYYEPVAFDGGVHTIVNVSVTANGSDARLGVRLVEPDGDEIAAATGSTVTLDRVQLPDTGEYTLRVSNASAGLPVAYDVRLDPVEIVDSPLDPSSTAYGDRLAGEIDPRDSRTSLGLSEQISFSGRANETVSARLTNATDPATLAIVGPNADVVDDTTTLARTETTGDGDPATVTATLPSDGQYSVTVANASDPPDHTFRYDLQVSGPRYDPRSVAYNETVPGTLTTDDPREGNRYFDRITFNGTAGDVVRVTATKRFEAFGDDTGLTLRSPTGGVVFDTSFTGSIFNSPFETVTLLSNGTYTLTVYTDFSRADEFDLADASDPAYHYDLSVRRTGTMDLRDPRSVTIGGFVEGELDDGDPVGYGATENDSEGRYEPLRFAADAGQVISLDVELERGRSARLEVLAPDGTTIRTARVASGRIVPNVRLPVAGNYTLIVTNDEPGGRFRYTASLYESSVVVPRDLESIGVPDRRNGTLDRSDAAVGADGRRRAESVTFDGSFGEQILVYVYPLLNENSPANATIELVSPSGDVVATRNWSSGFASIDRTLLNDGTYAFRVSGDVPPGYRYTYELETFRSGEPYEPRDVRSVPYGTPVTSEVDGDDPEGYGAGTDAARYEPVSFDARASAVARAEVTLRSLDRNPARIEILAPNGTTVATGVTDGRSVSVAFAPTADDNYTAVLTHAEPGGRFRYELALTALEYDVRRDLNETGYGETAAVSLDANDTDDGAAGNDSRRVVERVTFEGSLGDRARVDVRPIGTAPPNATVRLVSPRGVVAESASWGTAAGATLRRQLLENGTYTIAVAGTVADGESYDYVLDTRLTGEASPPDPRRLPVNGSVEGAIDDDDPSGSFGADPGSRHEPLTIDADAGQRLFVTVNGDGPVRVRLRTPSGQTIASGRGESVRFDGVTLPEPGAYTLIVANDEPGGRVSYRASASADQACAAGEAYVSQGSTATCLPIMGNGQTAEAFYDYPSESQQASTGLERGDTSLLFFWRGPKGLSLFFIHDESNEGTGGGRVELDIANYPAAGQWVVQDNPSAFPTDGYGGTPRWEWGPNNTDGGVVRCSLDGRRLTITPRTFEGITEWQYLSGSASSPARLPLDLSRPLNVTGFATNATASRTDDCGDRIDETRNDSEDGPLSASFGYAPAEPGPTESVAFDAGDSTTPANASNVTYEWTFGDGAGATGKRPTHTFADNGTYDVTLRLSTDNGTANATRTVTVNRTANVTVDNVTVRDPAAAYPPVQGVDKTVEANVSTANGTTVDRVEFHITGTNFAGRTIVDESGADGWSVEVETGNYTAGEPTDDGGVARDYTVTAEAITTDGENDSASAALGIADTGYLFELITDKGSTVPGSEAVAESRLDLLFPPLPSSVNVPIPPVGQLEAGAGLEVFARYYLDPNGIEPGFAGSLEVQIAVVGGKGAGTGKVLLLTGGDGVKTKRVSGTGFVKVGGMVSVPLEVLGYGIEPQFFFGPFVKTSATYDQIVPEKYPRIPKKATGFGGLQADGTVSVNVAVVSGEVQAIGRGGINSTFPGIFEKAALKGEILVKGEVATPVQEQEVKVKLLSGAVQLTSEAVAGAANNFTIRRHNGTAPLEGGPFEVNRSGAFAPAEVGRVTADEVADESPALVATPDGYLLAWDRQSTDRTALEGHDIYVRPADPGANFSTPVRVTNDSHADLDPGLAAREGTTDGGRLLAWSRVTRAYENASNVTVDRTFGATEVAVAADGGSADGNWSAPTVVTDGAETPGADFRPQVAPAGIDGRDGYLLAWRYDRDGDLATADRGVRYATYDPATGLGEVTEVPGARAPRVAPGRVAYVRQNGTTGNGTVVVRDLSGTVREFPTVDVGELAVSDRSAAWVADEGAAGNVSVRYLDANGSAGRVGTGPVQAVSDLDLATKRTADGTRIDVLSFQGTTPTRNGPGDRDLFYRLRRGDAWTPAKRLTPGDDGQNVTLAEPTTAGRAGGFTTVAVLDNATVGSPVVPDLVYTRHEYGRDLHVDASLATNRTGLAPGQEALLNYTVENRGALPARNVSLSVEAPAGRLATVDVGSVPAAGAAVGSVTVTVPAVRNLTVAATGDGGDLAPGDESTTVDLFRPDLAVTDVTRTPAAGSVSYDVTVRNRAPIPVDGTLRATNGPRSLGTVDAGIVPAGNATTTTITLDGTNLTPKVVTRLTAVPGDGLDADPTPADNQRRVRPPRPDAFVVGRLAGDSPFRPGTSPGRTLPVVVGNRGSLPATVTVSVRDDGRELATRTVDLPAGGPDGPAYRTVRVRADAIADRIGGEVTVRVSSAPSDADVSDNVATVEVPVPDTGTPFSRPVVPNGLVPTDPDGDGRYEDVDGDGRLTFVDVVALFVNFERRPVEANPRALDYNRNGRLDFGDVIALFESV